MRVSALRSPVIAGLATLAWAVALACASGPPAFAASTTTDSARWLPTSHAVPEEAALSLGRAAMERSLGNLRGVVENLSTIDYSLEPPFADADRAAFLLGQAYLELGGRERFAELARSVAGWKRQSPYTRWLAFQLALTETDLPSDTGAGRDSFSLASDSTGAAPIARRPAGSAAADALAAALPDGERAMGAARVESPARETLSRRAAVSEGSSVSASASWNASHRV